MNARRPLTPTLSPMGRGSADGADSPRHGDRVQAAVLAPSLLSGERVGVRDVSA